MQSKTVSIDFGSVFPTNDADRDKLVRLIEKHVQLHVQEIVDHNFYKHAGLEGFGPGLSPAMRLRVTVELVEG